MTRYNGKNYSLSYALENIGDYFWRMYKDDLYEHSLFMRRYSLGIKNLLW